MKFRYTGDLPVKDVDLVVGGIFKPTDVIVKGTVFEIPDDNALLIQRAKINGNYEEMPTAKVGRPKKDKKEEKEEEEK